MTGIDITSACLTLAAYIGFIYFTRNVRSFEDFSIGNQQVGWLFLFASVCATFVGPGFSMGLVRQGFSGGWFYFAMTVGYAAQLLAVGWVIGPALRKKFSSGTYSIGDIIAGEKTHNSKALRLIVGLVSFGLIVAFSIVMASAGGEVLSYFLGVEKIWGVLLITGLVTGYSFYGGIRASIYTDVLQFVIFCTMLPLLLVFAWNAMDMDSTVFFTRASTLTEKAFSGTDVTTMVALITSFTLGELLLPPLIGRILATRQPADARRSFVSAGMFVIGWLILMFSIGIVASFMQGQETNDKVLLELGKRALPAGLVGMFLMAMMAIIMSSLDSLLNYGATIFTRDVYLLLVPERSKDDHRQLWVSRWATLLIGSLATLCALFVPSVLQGLLYCYMLWIPCILVVLLASIFLKRYSVAAAIASILVGGVTTLVWNFSAWNETVPAILAGLSASLLAFVLVYRFTNSRVENAAVQA